MQKTLTGSKGAAGSDAGSSRAGSGREEGSPAPPEGQSKSRPSPARADGGHGEAGVESAPPLPSPSPCAPSRPARFLASSANASLLTASAQSQASCCLENSL